MLQRKSGQPDEVVVEEEDAGASKGGSRSLFE